MKKTIAALLAVVMCIALVGCGSGGAKTPENETEPEETMPVEETHVPEEDLAAFLDAMKVFDLDAATKYVDDDGEIEILALGDSKTDLGVDLAQLTQHLEYELGESTVDGESATVSVTVSNKSFEKIVEATTDEVVAYYLENGEMSDEELNAKTLELMQEVFATGDVERESQTVDVHMSLKDDAWQIEYDDLFVLMDAALGGMLNF